MRKINTYVKKSAGAYFALHWLRSGKKIQRVKYKKGVFSLNNFLRQLYVS